MKNLISFSGGKDSTALILWAIEKLSDFDIVFCDTGFEHEITYQYIEYVKTEVVPDREFITLKSDKYDGFADMAIKRKRVPSAKARFCTQELKLFPFEKYAREELSGNAEIYLGIRADESPSRAKMPERNFDMDYYGCWMNRPLIRWSADDVFAIHKKHGVEPNPLYKMCMNRVGCMPCIMANNSELKQIFKRFPDVVENIRKIEAEIGTSYFAYDAIPQRFCSGYDEKSGKKFPWVDDVVRYLQDNPDQENIFEDEPQSCMSYYNICE